MEITFLGGTETVTGSKYLIKKNSRKLLVDCGLFQGYKELRLRNWSQFPLPPSQIESVLLTHAHIDHTGYLPVLIKNGFSGKIYCTEGTLDLCNILLPDSGHLQEEEAKYANMHGYSKHTPALPLYTLSEAKSALKQFKSEPYNTKFNVLNDLSVEFIPSGHIIGSAFVRLQDENTSLLFSGDLGRPQDPVMKPPSIITDIDYLVLESTYGDRLHEKENPVELLKEIINETVGKGGSVIVPAFAVGRAQLLLYYLYLLKKDHAIPNIPIYLDSPMAIDATDILCKNIKDIKLDENISREFSRIAIYTRTVEQSMAIDANPMPKIIISASGMATGGRVLHHLKAYGSNYKNTILFTGFQSGGTRGDRIMKGETEVKMLGEMVPIRARVEMLTNTSAHADYDEILEWLKHFKKPPKKVFITHGEQSAALSLKDKIEKTFSWNCIIPRYMQKEIL